MGVGFGWGSKGSGEMHKTLNTRIAPKKKATADRNFNGQWDIFPDIPSQSHTRHTMYFIHICLPLPNPHPSRLPFLLNFMCDQHQLIGSPRPNNAKAHRARISHLRGTMKSSWMVFSLSEYRNINTAIAFTIIIITYIIIIIIKHIDIDIGLVVILFLNCFNKYLRTPDTSIAYIANAQTILSLAYTITIQWPYVSSDMDGKSYQRSVWIFILMFEIYIYYGWVSTELRCQKNKCFK